MKISKLLCFALSVFVALFAGCGSDYDSTKDSECDSCNVIAPDNPKSYYTVIADEQLSEDYKIAIFKSLDEWSVKTGFTLKYHLSFEDMSMNPPSYVSHTIKIYVKDPGPGYLGWTSWSSSDYSAYVYVRPSIEGELFRQVMLHEFGHAFNLSFDGDIHYKGPHASVMTPAVSQPHLCCPELKAFCEEFNCQIDCSEKESGVMEPTNVVWLETEFKK